MSQPFVVCNIDWSKEPSWAGLGKKLTPWVLLPHPSLKIAVVGWASAPVARRTRAHIHLLAPHHGWAVSS